MLQFILNSLLLSIYGGLAVTCERRVDVKE